MAFWKKWFEPKPFNEGYLRVSPVHEIYYREFGNPKGKPAVCLHGGPGYRSNADTARNFNLHRRRVVLFDQRGAGRSRPAGEVKDNTTPDLVEDIRRLLDFLQIKDKVLVYPLGKGSTSSATWILDTTRCGNAPKAFINRETELIILTGAVLSSELYGVTIPVVDRLDKDPIEVIETGDWVKVDGDHGIVEVTKRAK